jgi:tetratricopeptide (TPR) repeat protein
LQSSSTTKDKTFSAAVEPVGLAVMLSREIADKPLLRKALNLQGIILLTTSNPGDAIRSLAEALEIAQALGDPGCKEAVLNNLGGAFYEAALYSDARDGYCSAAELAIGVKAFRSIRSAALSNGATCCLHLHELVKGMEQIKDSISLLPAPSDPAEMLSRVLAEGTYTRLLLATGRVREAAERAQLAKEMCWSTRRRCGRTFLQRVLKALLRCIRDSRTWA